MSARLALLFLFLVVVPAVGPAAQDARPSILAFVNARIIDGAGGAPIRNGAMVVQDGRIAAIGPMSIVNIPAERDPRQRRGPDDDARHDQRARPRR